VVYDTLCAGVRESGGNCSKEPRRSRGYSGTPISHRRKELQQSDRVQIITERKPGRGPTCRTARGMSLTACCTFPRFRNKRIGEMPLVRATTMCILV
jgi:hypothetical protein